MDSERPTYIEYISQFHKKTETVSLEVINEYKKKYNIIDTIYTSGPTAPYLVDLTNLSYPYMCVSVENIFGIQAVEFMNKGVKLLYENMHEDDLKIMHENVIPSFKKIRNKQTFENIAKLRYTYSYRLKHPAKGFVSILEQVIPLEVDENGIAVLMFGIISDITAYKPDHTMAATVSVLNKANEYRTIFYEDYKSRKPNILTKREMDILRLLAKGFSSLDIGKKLFISNTTVDKHRRNMLVKTKKKNTMELVFLMLNQGWL